MQDNINEYIRSQGIKNVLTPTFGDWKKSDQLHIADLKASQNSKNKHISTQEAQTSPQTYSAKYRTKFRFQNNYNILLKHPKISKKSPLFEKFGQGQLFQPLQFKDNIKYLSEQKMCE